MRPANLHVPLILCVAFFISPLGDAHAELTTYSIISQIKHKSIVSKSLFNDHTHLIKYYKKKDNIYLFSNNEDTAFSLNSFASKAYKNIVNDINLSLIKRDSIDIVIFAVNDRLWEQLKLPKHSSALYCKGFNEIFVRIDGNKREIFGSLVHEMTHLIIDNMDRKIPLWFEEGMSQFKQYQYLNDYKLPNTIHYSKRKLKNMLHERDLDVENVVSRSNYNYNDIKLFYELSFQLIKMIHKKGNLHIFSSDYVIKGLDFVTSIKQNVGYQLNNYDAIDNELKTFILNL